MDLKKLNQKKSKLETQLVIFIFVIVVSFFTFIVNPIGMVFFIIGAVGAALTSKQFKTLSNQFKTTYLKEIIEKEIESIIYEPEKGFDKEIVYGSKLLKKEDRYYSEDYMKGQIKGKNFECADLKLQDVRSNGKSTTVVTVFQGRFFIIDFEKKFDSDVYITPNRSYGFNWFSDMEKVDVESIVFNNAYDVYASDKHSAFYLLKHVFVEKLVEFRSVAKRVFFGFKDQKVYIALDTKKDAFDLKMFRTIDSTFIDEVKHELKLIEELIELIP